MGSGRDFCEDELNYRIRDFAFRNGTLGWNTLSGWNSRAKSFTVRKIWDVGIANDIEWLVYKTIQYKLYAVLSQNSQVNKPLRLSQATNLLNR